MLPCRSLDGTGLPPCMAVPGCEKRAGVCRTKGLRAGVVLLGTSHFPVSVPLCTVSGSLFERLALVFVSPGNVPAGRAKISPEEWAGALTSVT